MENYNDFTSDEKRAMAMDYIHETVARLLEENECFCEGPSMSLWLYLKMRLDSIYENGFFEIHAALESGDVAQALELVESLKSELVEIFAISVISSDDPEIVSFANFITKIDDALNYYSSSENLRDRIDSLECDLSFNQIMKPFHLFA